MAPRSVACAVAQQPAAATQDTMVIAIGALPQGIDLDKHVSPQTWTMGAQVLEDGMNWESIEFPFSTGHAWDPSTIPGFMYPDYMGQKTLVPGLIEKCEMEPDGMRAVYHLRQGVISPWGNEFSADDVVWRIERGKATQAINNFLEFLLSMPGQTIDPPESGGYAILLTAGLSFVGAGVRPPTPELGAMIASGAKHLEIGQWWAAFFPGLALGLIVFSFGVFGEIMTRAMEPRAVRRETDRRREAALEAGGGEPQAPDAGGKDRRNQRNRTLV